MSIFHHVWLWQATLSFADAIIVFVLLPFLTFCVVFIGVDMHRQKTRHNRHKRSRRNVHHQ